MRITQKALSSFNVPKSDALLAWDNGIHIDPAENISDNSGLLTQSSNNGGIIDESEAGLQPESASHSKADTEILNDIDSEKNLIDDKSGVVNDGAGETGKYIDNTTDTLTKGEKQVIDDLVGQGKTVERIPKSDVKTPDFKVNGVKTELKTLENANTNTGMKRIQEGFKQGAETVIIDARGSGLTNSQASEILSRVSGKYSNKQLPGNVEIWIDGKVITYP